MLKNREAAPPLRFWQGWEFVTNGAGVSSQLSALRQPGVCACPPVFAAPTALDIFTSSRSVVTGEAAPPLRFWQGWEFVTNGAAVSSQLSALRQPGVWACPSSPRLRHWISSLHHVQLLPAPSVARRATVSRSLSAHRRRDTNPLRSCRGRICGHAGACASALVRAGRIQTFCRHAGSQAALLSRTAGDPPTTNVMSVVATNSRCGPESAVFRISSRSRT